MSQIPFVIPLGGRWQGHGHCLIQHCHQKSICQTCFKDTPRAVRAVCSPLGDVFPGHRLSVPHLLQGARGWGLFVGFACQATLPQPRWQSFPGCQGSCGAPEELSSISIPVLGCQSLAGALCSTLQCPPSCPILALLFPLLVSFVPLPFIWGWPCPRTFPLAFAVSCSCVWRESDSNVEHFAVARYSLQGHSQLLLLVPSRNVSLITHINIKGREGKLGGREGGFCYFFLTQFPSFTSIRFSETDELLHPFSLRYLLHNSIWIFRKSCLAQPSLPSLSAWVPYFYSLFLGNCIQTLSLFFVC